MALPTLNFYPRKDPKMRFFALWYFTTLLTAWTILGDTVLGFEQSYAQPIVGVLAAFAVAILLEWLDARMNEAARQGRDLAEVMAMPIPDKYRSWGAMPAEYLRNVTRLYPAREEAALGH